MSCLVMPDFIVTHPATHFGPCTGLLAPSLRQSHSHFHVWYNTYSLSQPRTANQEHTDGAITGSDEYHGNDAE